MHLPHLNFVPLFFIFLFIFMLKVLVFKTLLSNKRKAIDLSLLRKSKVFIFEKALKNCFFLEYILYYKL